MSIQKNNTSLSCNLSPDSTIIPRTSTSTYIDLWDKYTTTANFSYQVNPIYNIEIEAAEFSKMIQSSCLQKIFLDKQCEITPISKIEILAKNKVIRFTFADTIVIKTICSSEDTFDFTKAFYIAYAKYYFKHILTSEGIEKIAEILSYHKKFKKAVEKGIKLYNKNLKEEEDKKKKENELKEIKRRQREKKIRKKKERKEKQK